MAQLKGRSWLPPRPGATQSAMPTSTPAGDRERRPTRGAPDVDIGGISGALVVTTPARLHGAEIEIRAEGEPWSGAHAVVRRHLAGGGAHYAGVFPRLDAGSYEFRVLGAGSGVVVPVAITPGMVVETWLDAPVD